MSAVDQATPQAPQDDIDLLGLTPAEILSYAHTLRDDLDAMRDLLDEALTLIGAQRDQLDRATWTIESLQQKRVA